VDKRNQDDLADTDQEDDFDDDEEYVDNLDEDVVENPYLETYDDDLFSSKKKMLGSM